MEARSAAGFAHGTRLPPTPTFRLQPRFNVRPRPGAPDLPLGPVAPTPDHFRLKQAF